MKKIAIGLLIFLLGVLGTLWFTREKIEMIPETKLIYNGLEQISKLQVTQGYFTEVYTFKDSKTYWNDLVSFDKKALVVANVKAQIAYDLKQLDIEIDSIQKRIEVKHIPEPEVTLVPNISYYDVQQSTFNSFTAEDYNTIKDDLMKNLEDNQAVKDLKAQAHDRLFEELSKLLVLSKIYQWEVVDQTQSIDLDLNFKD
ncbi:MAG: DUF4230 domain-containing protein [Flavobacteriaceae bacterium]|nr:DUF4230 domain-containing protein [Flavobacteriaceae bacterium]